MAELTLSAIHLCNVLPPETLQQVKVGLLYAQANFPKSEEYKLLRQDIECGLRTVQRVENLRKEQARRAEDAERVAGEIIKRIFK